MQRDASRTAPDGTAGRAELLALLADHYPGAIALGLLKLCGPCCTIHHACRAPGKRPTDDAWTDDAAARWADPDADPDRHRARIADHVARGGNLGWCPPPGVLVLDADTPEAVAYLDRALPDAPAQDTASGAHFVVRLPEGVSVPARSGVALAPDIVVDLRPGGAAQIVVAPSVHASGTPYQWRHSLPADLADLPEIPGGLLAALLAALGATPGRERTRTNGTKFGEGARNDYLFYTVACGMRGRGRSEPEIRDGRTDSPPL